MNLYATSPTYLMPNSLLWREALRARIRRDHDPWTENEPVTISAGRLPQYETKIPQAVQYRGDGRVPEDIL